MSTSTRFNPASVDFRSDTATTPTQSMLESVLQASIGDDVNNEDDDINELQDYVAQLTGKEAGLYVVSGTMSNQLAIRTHLLTPPSSLICDYRAHIVVDESAGIAQLSNAMPYGIVPSNGKYLTLEDICARVVPDFGNIHFAPTKLISLENTLHGEVYPFEELQRISKFFRGKGFKLHCDGARLWNAHVATGIPLSQYGELFDTISLCLSKSLGAPVGSVLVGDKEFITKALHFRKQIGGGIRQGGMLARMAMIAIKENLPKLAKVNQVTKEVAKRLEANGLVIRESVDTNFIFIDYTKTPIENETLDLIAKREKINVWPQRIAFHYQNIEDQEVLDKLVKVFTEAFELTRDTPELMQKHKDIVFTMEY
ncbi:hypothetical protein WICPIJ_009750 [Wickerhamomyces pijperi]|uniref:low-specificity L-threonine aldolase n=1 Tax=Wickerhamomyces pijperi TaxID=599730 RepID=A0A9P8PKF3_WICPI|nr:hypothetical protein WICPIJ_009750 [Wickerhamomyces pijperi]